MSSECKIFLENYSGLYCGDADVVGRIECYFNDATTVRGIKIRLICREHNDWYENVSHYDSSAKKTRTRRVHFTGTHEPIHLEQMLFGSDSGKKTLPPGKHCFPFSITLPKMIPSSFDGPYGSISYSLKAVVDRPMAFDYEDSFAFMVKSPLDLRSFPEDDLLPNNYSDEKTVCCWCCKGGLVTVDVDLPKNAFMPGEVVNFKVTVINLSNVNVDALQVTLQKEITFKVTSPSTKYREDNEDILTIKEHGVGAHGEYTYYLQMIIPEYLEVPNFTLCTLFSASYILTVSAEMDGCTCNLDIYIHPKMGHIHTDLNRKPVTPQLGFVTSPPYVPPGPVQAGPSYPTVPVPGINQPGPVYPPPYPGTNEKPVYPSGPPTAPSTYADAPPEAAAASAPPASQGTNEGVSTEVAGASTPLLHPPELPPPSYNDAMEK